MRASVRLAKVSILCCLGMLNGELMRRCGAHQKLLLGRRLGCAKAGRAVSGFVETARLLGVQIVICYENLLVLFLFGEQAFDFGAE